MQAIKSELWREVVEAHARPVTKPKLRKKKSVHIKQGTYHDESPNLPLQTRLYIRRVGFVTTVDPYNDLSFTFEIKQVQALAGSC